jgi:hypothetical protein
MFNDQTGEVTIEFGGAPRSGRYEVSNGRIRVISEFGERAVDLGSIPLHPEYVARFLLEDLVRGATGDERD